MGCSPAIVLARVRWVSAGAYNTRFRTIAIHIVAIVKRAMIPVMIRVTKLVTTLAIKRVLTNAAPTILSRVM